MFYKPVHLVAIEVHNMKSYLILVRHGESRWNIANKFTGWVDVPLSEVGVHEAMITARRLEDLKLDVAFTSKLERARDTLGIILSEQQTTGIYLHHGEKRQKWHQKNNGEEFGKNEIPIRSSWRLNERYYGNLQGLNKNYAREKWGKDQVHIWRRSYSIKPPGGESLKDVYKRAIPYFRSTVMKHVKAHQNVLVAAHGNSLRAIIKWIENVEDKDIPHLELETGKPIIYEYHKGKLKLLDHVHGFDRPTEWKHAPKHTRGKTKKQKSKTKSSVKKSTTKKTSKKTSSKKTAKRSSKKKVAKKSTRKKSSTKK